MLGFFVLFCFSPILSQFGGLKGGPQFMKTLSVDFTHLWMELPSILHFCCCCFCFALRKDNLANILSFLFHFYISPSAGSNFTNVFHCFVKVLKGVHMCLFFPHFFIFFQEKDPEPCWNQHRTLCSASAGYRCWRVPGACVCQALCGLTLRYSILPITQWSALWLPCFQFKTNQPTSRS